MKPDWLRQSGLVVFTENVEACVRFYRDLIGLKQLFDYGDVVGLRFGEGYIIIEGGGRAEPQGKSRRDGPVTLRFNVDDVEAVATLLRSRGVAVDVLHLDFGTIGAFMDPDGNRCELRNHGPDFISDQDVGTSGKL